MWLIAVPGAIVLLVILIVWFAYSSLPARFERWVQRVTKAGSVEGTLYIDGEPAPRGIWVTSCYIVPQYGSDGTIEFESCEEYTQTAEGGLFHFRFLPVGEVGVGRRFECGGRQYSEVDRRIEVRAGETVRVDLGAGKGRVTGRLSLPVGFDGPTAPEELPPVWLECLDRFPGPEGEDRVLEYSGAWRAPGSVSGVWRRDDHRWRFALLDANRMFDVWGMHPGRYGLKVNTYDEIASDSAGAFQLLTGPEGSGITLIDIPPTPDGGIVCIDAGVIVVPSAVLERQEKGSIQGTLYIDGAPAPEGTEVRCQTMRDILSYYEGAEPEVLGCYHVDFAEAKTQAGGRFEFPGLPAGSATVEWRCNRSVVNDDLDSESCGGNEIEVEVAPGQTVEIRLDCTAA